MSALPGPANPIFYSQFRIRGGWRVMLFLDIGYAIIIGSLIAFSAHAADVRNYSSSLRAWLSALLSLQIFFLLVFGSSRVSAAVRGDVTGKIIESHRMMPLSAFSAIIGYVTGPPIQTISLAVVTFILGIFTSQAAGIELQRWIIANAMLGAFVLLIWVVTAHLTFATRVGFVAPVVGILIAIFTNASTMILLPALTVLTCPLLGRSVFNLQATFSDVTYPYLMALVAQFLIGAVFFAAAMRKYRLPDAVGFNAGLGLALLAVWTAISLAGMHYIDLFTSRYYWRGSNEILVTQFIASITCSMLLALVPISSSARAIADFRRNDYPESNHVRPVSSLFVTILAVLVICLYLIFPPAGLHSQHSLMIAMAQTAIIVLAFALSMLLLLRWAYVIVSKAWIILLIWIVLIGLAPMVGDAIYRAALDKSETSAGIISTLSPIGAMIVAWNHGEVPMAPGIAFQCAILLLPAMLYFSTSRRQARKQLSANVSAVPTVA